MQPGDWEVEFPGKEAEDRGDSSRSTLIWVTAVAVLIVIGGGLAILAIWLTDSPDPPAAVPEVEIPATPAPIPEAEIPTTPAPIVQLPDVAELDEAGDNEVAFGRVNVTLADGTELFMRLPGIGDDSEVSLWDRTQFVVDRFAVSVYFESCTNRGYDAPEPNERGQHLQLPDPSIAVLCESDFPLSAVLFWGDDWRSDELEQLEMQLLSVGSELTFIMQGRAIGSRACCQALGPIRAGQIVAFSQGYLGGTVTAINPESGNTAWELSLGETSFLLAATDGVVLASPQKGSAIAIDATTGSEIWRAEFDEQASVTSAVPIGDGEWLLAYEYRNEGDPSPPGLTRFDAFGDLLWTATGHEGTDWQWNNPIASAGRVFMRDVPYFWADDGRVSVTAFDTESGELLWQTELDSTSDGFSTSDLALSQDSGSFLVAILHDKDQIVRLDAATGEIEWMAIHEPSRIVSVTDSRIRLRNLFTNTQYDIDPDNGLLQLVR